MDRISILTLGAALAATKSQTEGYVAEAIGDFDNGLTLKGSVGYADQLPSSGNTLGDEYIVKYRGLSSDAGTEQSGEKYAWDGTDWICVGPNLRLYRDADGDLCEED